MKLSNGGAESPCKYAVAVTHPIYGAQYRLKTAVNADGPFWHPFINENTMLFDRQSDAVRAALAVKGFSDLMGSVYQTAHVVAVTLTNAHTHA